MTENKRFNCHFKFSKMPNGIMVLDYTKHGDEQLVIEDISRDKAHRVMDKLNELADESEQLKQFRNIARDYNIPFEKLCDAFEDVLEENVQLKQKNKQYSMMVNANSDLNDKIYIQLQKTEKNYKSLLEENEQLQNQIDELEDDNEKYSKSLDKLEDYTKRFIPTKCLNEFKDCKTNRYYWLDHEGNFEGALELLNLMDCENEKLKQKIKELEIKNEAQSDAIDGLQATLCHLDFEEMME